MHNQTANEQTINFYLEKLCSRADEVFRFSYLLTLDQKTAYLCLEKTFHLLGQSLLQSSQLQNAAHLNFELAKTSWQAFNSLKIEGLRPDSTLGQKLASLSLEERALLAAVEVLGLSPSEAASVFNWQEASGRSHLGQVDKKLCLLALEPIKNSAQGA